MHKLLSRMDAVLALPQEGSPPIQKKEGFCQLRADLERLKIAREALAGSMETAPGELFYLSHSHEEWRQFLRRYEAVGTRNSAGFHKLEQRIALTGATLSSAM